MLRYIARSANQLEEIEYDSTDEEDRLKVARWKSNDLAVGEDSKNAWIEQLVRPITRDFEFELSSSDNENE